MFKLNVNYNGLGLWFWQSCLRITQLTSFHSKSLSLSLKGIRLYPLQRPSLMPVRDYPFRACSLSLSRLGIISLFYIAKVRIFQRGTKFRHSVTCKNLLKTVVSAFATMPQCHFATLSICRIRTLML